MPHRFELRSFSGLKENIGIFFDVIMIKRKSSISRLYNKID